MSRQVKEQPSLYAAVQINNTCAVTWNNASHYPTMGLLHGLRSAGHALIVLAITIIEVVVIGLVAYLVIYLGYNAYRTMRQKTWLQVKAQYPNCAADAARGMEPEVPSSADPVDTTEPGEVPVKSLEAQGLAPTKPSSIHQSQRPHQGPPVSQSGASKSTNHSASHNVGHSVGHRSGVVQHHHVTQSGGPHSVTTHHHHAGGTHTVTTHSHTGPQAKP